MSTLSIFAATSALTTLPWGFAFEHIQVRYGAMMMSGLLFLSVLVLLVANSYPLAVAFALLFGVAIGAGNIVEQMLWAEYFGREHLGAIRAFGAPFRIASPSGPFLTGPPLRLDGLLHPAIHHLRRDLRGDDIRDVLREATGEAGDSVPPSTASLCPA